MSFRLANVPEERRFPLPWTAEEQPACFVVRDHNGQQLAYVLNDIDDAFTALLQSDPDPAVADKVANLRDKFRDAYEYRHAVLLFSWL